MDKKRRPNPMAKDLMNPKYRPKVYLTRNVLPFARRSTKEIKKMKAREELLREIGELKKRIEQLEAQLKIWKGTAP